MQELKEYLGDIEGATFVGSKDLAELCGLIFSKAGFILKIEETLETLKVKGYKDILFPTQLLERIKELNTGSGSIVEKQANLFAWILEADYTGKNRVDAKDLLSIIFSKLS